MPKRPRRSCVRIHLPAPAGVRPQHESFNSRVRHPSGRDRRSFRDAPKVWGAPQVLRRNVQQVPTGQTAPWTLNQTDLSHRRMCFSKSCAVPRRIHASPIMSHEKSCGKPKRFALPIPGGAHDKATDSIGGFCLKHVLLKHVT